MLISCQTAKYKILGGVAAIVVACVNAQAIAQPVPVKVSRVSAAVGAHRAVHPPQHLPAHHVQRHFVHSHLGHWHHGFGHHHHHFWNASHVWYGSPYFGRWGVGCGNVSWGFRVTVGWPYHGYGYYPAWRFYPVTFRPFVPIITYPTFNPYRSYWLAFAAATQNVPAAPVPVAPAAMAAKVPAAIGLKPAGGQVTAHPTVIPVSAAANDFQRQAEQAFLSGDYDDAARLAAHALIEDANNGRLQLFVSQIRFAQGQYDLAANAIRQADRLLPDPERGFVVEQRDRLYQGTSFVQQIEALDDYLAQRPDDSDAHFVRAYQSFYVGWTSRAERHLRESTRLNPGDVVARALRDQVGRFSVDIPQTPLIPALDNTAFLARGNTD